MNDFIFFSRSVLDYDKKVNSPLSKNLVEIMKAIPIVTFYFETEAKPDEYRFNINLEKNNFLRKSFTTGR